MTTSKSTKLGVLEAWNCHRIIASPAATRVEVLLEKAVLGRPAIRRYKEASQASHWSHCVNTYQVTAVQQGTKSVPTECVGTKLDELSKNGLTDCETNVNAYKQL